MPPSEKPLPAPPIVVYLLDNLLPPRHGAPPRTTAPERPSKAEELQAMLISLNALNNTAIRRAKGAADAVRIGRESLARSNWGWKVDEGDKGKRGRVKEERGKVGLPEVRRKEGSVNGMAKVKRELSASPAPTSASEYARPSSRLGTPADISAPGLSDRSTLKQKKRKLAHLASPEEAESASSFRRAGSSTREGSVSAGAERAPAMAVSMGGTDRAASVQAAPSLKLKLSLSNSGKNRSSLPPTEIAPFRSQTTPSAATDSTVQQLVNFSLPVPGTSYESLVPARPPIPHPPKPLPKRQKDVNQDFSTVKHVTQSVQWSTFWNGVEPYLKDFGEEELAMLGFRPEDVEPFLIPPLGKHYQDIWDEEDSSLPFASSSTTGPPAINVWDLATGGRKSRQVASPAALSRERTYVPVTEMAEEDLWDEAKGLGGLSERAAAALVKVDAPPLKEIEDGVGQSGPDSSQTVRPPSTPRGAVPELQVNGDLVSPPKDVKPFIPLTPSRGREPTSDTPRHDDEREAYSWPIRPHRIASPPHRANERDLAAVLEVDVGQLEEGVAREMRLLGLLDAEESVDWSMREDDEISCALRSCQRLLRTQVAVNNARKDRLLQVTKERLAYSEYKKVLEGLEKLIEQAWTKRYAALKKAGKKQKGKAKEHAAADGAAPAITQTPSKRREGIPPLSDQVKLAMSARRRWLDTVGHALENDPVVGRYRGLPRESIYEGVDERGREVRPLRAHEEQDAHEMAEVGDDAG